MKVTLLWSKEAHTYAMVMVTDEHAATMHTKHLLQVIKMLQVLRGGYSEIGLIFHSSIIAEAKDAILQAIKIKMAV